MERSGFAKAEVDIAKGVFKILFRGDFNRRQAIDYLQNGSGLAGEEITSEIIKFAQESERGLA